ncbi:hypothetical protein [Nocardioides ferulae]|uniref:hypothetical protein n=1 Tax=Nocardioides ferulae TaxID=2340821 RepID=UPI000EAB63CE|nr:hypothetical protein [Nocardioides ferulae]
MEHRDAALLRLYVMLDTLARPLRQRRDERGDVPGWVFITVMSVGLVGAIGSVARGELQGILSAALGQVR